MQRSTYAARRIEWRRCKLASRSGQGQVRVHCFFAFGSHMYPMTMTGSSSPSRWRRPRRDKWCVPGREKGSARVSGITSCRHSSAGVIARSSDAAAAAARSRALRYGRRAWAWLSDWSSEEQKQACLGMEQMQHARKWGETRSKSTPPSGGKIARAGIPLALGTRRPRRGNSAAPPHRMVPMRRRQLSTRYGGSISETPTFDLTRFKFNQGHMITLYAVMD
jgi:hypothetical protein